jgi:hypothetical protein
VVEHDLAKVGVAGSNPVSRSSISSALLTVPTASILTMRAALLVLLTLGVFGCAARQPEPTLGSMLAPLSRPGVVTDAWVLWWGLGGSFWMRDSGYETPAECDAKGQMLRDVTDKVAREAVVAMQSKLGRGFADLSMLVRWQFRCLPPSVDPRGPKRPAAPVILWDQASAGN